MHIAIDFDGTIVTNQYPKVGTLMLGAKKSINELYDDHTIIINTCRSGAYADRCRRYLDKSGIKYHFFNENDPTLIKQYNGDTRKISADVYIDDKNLGGFLGWEYTMRMLKTQLERKPVIICIMGESGSGKTHLADYLERTFNIPMIQSYTTRPRRSPKENGHTFITNEEFDKFLTEDMIAYTKFGDHRYCCLKSDVKPVNTYVIDEDGYNMLRKKYAGEYELYSIRVMCNKPDREERVGAARVARDEGRFSLPLSMFHLVWKTDNWRLKSMPYDQLFTFVVKILRVWN